jgi:hypothetical protein
LKLGRELTRHAGYAVIPAQSLRGNDEVYLHPGLDGTNSFPCP